MSRFRLSQLAQPGLVVAAVGLTIAALQLGYQHSQRPLPPPPPGGFAYVANAADNSLWIFRYDLNSGWLDFTSTAVNAGRFPAVLASHGPYLYAGNAFGASLSGWRADPESGKLQELPGSPWPAGKGLAHLVLNPAGDTVYGSNSSANSLGAWHAAANGRLSPLPGSPYGGLDSPAGLALVGGFLYVAESAANRISRYPVNTDGSPGAVAASTPSNKAPDSLGSDPGGHYLFACNHDSNSLGAWRIGNDGSLSALPGSPYATGVHPASVRVDASGHYIYVANEDSSSLSAWRLDDTGLRPLAGAPFATGKAPHTISLSPDGRYLYTANSGDKTLSGYQINPSNGQLTELPDSPFATGYGPADVGFIP